MRVDLYSLCPPAAIEGKTCAIFFVSCADTCANLRFMLAKPLLHNWSFMWQDVPIYVASVFAMAVCFRIKSAKVVALLKPMRSRALSRKACGEGFSVTESWTVHGVGSSHGIPDRLDVFTQLDLLVPLKNSSVLGTGCKWHYALARNSRWTCAELFYARIWELCVGFAGGLCCWKAWLLVRWAAGGFCCWQACRQYYNCYFKLYYIVYI